MLELVSYTNKTGENEWEARMTFKGNSKEISAVTKFLSALVFLLREHLLLEDETDG